MHRQHPHAWHSTEAGPLACRCLLLALISGGLPPSLAWSLPRQHFPPHGGHILRCAPQALHSHWTANIDYLAATSSPPTLRCRHLYSAPIIPSITALTLPNQPMSPFLLLLLLLLLLALLSCCTLGDFVRLEHVEHCHHHLRKVWALRWILEHARQAQGY